MTLNGNQKSIRKGYAKIAKQLGSVVGVYRPSNHTFTSSLDPRNWLYDIPFAASVNSGFQSTQKYGVPSLQGFFDSTDIEPGDLFYDGDNTYYVGDIPLFEPPMVIQCFNTISVYRRAWDKTTRTNKETLIAKDIPCNIQNGSDKMFDRDPQSFSNQDTQHVWSVNTWFPDGIIQVNDKVVLDNGKDSQVSDVFHTQHGLSIRLTEILGD